MAENEKSKLYGWWVTIISTLTCFGIYASVTAYSVAIPKIAIALDVAKPEASLGVSIFLVGLALSLMVGGMIIDAIGVKKTVMLGMALLIIPQFVIPMIAEPGNLYLLYILRFIQGFSLMVWSAFIVSIVSWIPIQQKGLATALFLGGSIGGSGIGGIIAGQVIPTYGWESVFYILGALPLIFVIIWELTVKVKKAPAPAPAPVAASSTEGATAAPAKPVKPKKDYKSLVKMSETWFLALVIIGNMWMYFGISGTIAQYGYYLDYSIPQMGNLTLGFMPACLIGAVLAGILADRAAKKSKDPVGGRSFIMLIGLSVAMVASFFIPILGPTGYMAFLVIVTITMFFNAMAQGAYWAIPSDTYPKHLMSAGSTFSCGIGSLPKPLSPLVIALVLAPAWDLGYWTMSIISVLAVIGAIGLIRKHKMK